MRWRRPGVVERAFELDRPDQQPRHVAAVGVLAAHADLAHAGEIVDVVLLDVGAGEVADGPLEHEAGERRRSTRSGPPDRGERAAAIATQAQVHAEARRPLLERRESPGQRIVRGQRCQDNAVQPRRAGDSCSDRELAGIEPHHQERRLLPCRRELPLAQGQRHVLRPLARGMQIDLIDAGLLDRDRLRRGRISADDRVCSLRRSCRRARIEQQPVVVLRRGHGDPEPAVIGELAERDLEIRPGSVGPLALKDLVIRDRRPQQQALRDRAVREPFGIAGSAAHAGEDRVIDAVVLSPAADRVVARVALDEAILRPHRERLEVERLAEPRLRDHEVPIVQQQAVRSQDQLVRARLGIDAGTEVDAEILDLRPGLRVDDAAIERLFGDLEVRLEQQGREGQRLLVVHEPVTRDGVRRQHLREVVFEQQQLPERVAILRDGQPPRPSVLGRRPRPCELLRLRNPVAHPFPIGGTRLRFVLGRHGFVRELLADAVPQLELTVLETPIEMVDANPGRALLLVVAPLAILLQERLHLEIKRSAKRTLSLSSVHGGGCGLEQDQGGEWQDAEGANVLDAGTDHESDSSRSSG